MRASCSLGRRNRSALRQALYAWSVVSSSSPGLQRIRPQHCIHAGRGIADPGDGRRWGTDQLGQRLANRVEDLFQLVNKKLNRLPFHPLPPSLLRFQHRRGQAPNDPWFRNASSESSNQCCRPRTSQPILCHVDSPRIDGSGWSSYSARVWPVYHTVSLVDAISLKGSQRAGQTEGGRAERQQLDWSLENDVGSHDHSRRDSRISRCGHHARGSGPVPVGSSGRASATGTGRTRLFPGTARPGRWTAPITCSSWIAAKRRADPASRYQPRGIAGPSRVVDLGFPWTDQDWRGRPLQQLVCMNCTSVVSLPAAISTECSPNWTCSVIWGSTRSS